MKKSLAKILSLILCVSLVMSCMVFGVSAQEASAEAPFRISSTINGDPSTQRGFCWYTKTETKSVVTISNELGLPVNANITYEEVFEWEGNYCHKALATGLEPGKTYYFDVGDGTTFSPVGKFVTDDGDDSFNFIAIADIQASSLENFERAAATVDAAFKTMPNAEFFVSLGDFTNDSTNEEWDYYDEAMKGINLSNTIVPVAGNHDGLGVPHWFNNMFSLDTSESVQVKDGVNYSFDYGNAHIAVLNTNDILAMSNAQLKWLKNDMNGTDKDWKIVFMHKSPYTLGKDGKWPDALYLQSSLAKKLDACDVDLVMSGHDHMYLRTKPLDKKGNVDENGTTYVLAGTAGTKRYEIRSFLAGHFIDTDVIEAMTVQKDGYANYWDGEDWDQTKDTNVGGCFNCINIDGGTLTLTTYILADASTEENPIITQIDTMTLTKETGKNEITFEGDNTTSDLEYKLDVVPSFLSLAVYALGTWLPKFLVMLPDLLTVYINEGTF